MGDRFGIDSHKLAYHPRRVAEWAEGGGDWETARNIYPIYVEISPAGACNHRCVFCAVDYIGYKTRFLDQGILKERLSEMAGKGVRSVMWAGEGEPLAHKGISSLIRHARDSGIDNSLTTNAVLLSEKIVEEALPSLAWLKASIDAGTAETYAAIHGAKTGDFEKVMENLSRAVLFKKKNGLKTALGAQMVLLPENAKEAPLLARRVKDIGLDYLVVKPFSQHAMSIGRRYEDLRCDDLMKLWCGLEKLDGDGFEVVFRRQAMGKCDAPDRRYAACHATPYFWAYIMANGDLYGCSAYLTDERFRYGNILKNSFGEIWGGDARRENWRYIRGELDISRCRRSCRMDEVNRYLWGIKNPPEHVNFI